MSEDSQRRPYAATANVVGVLHRTRTRNLPDKIDDDFLRIVQVPDVVFGRVTEALRFLNLTTETNAPTEALKALAAAPDAEYKAILEGVVRDSYKDDFARVDPSQDSQAQIIDAFKPYEPRSQTARMVMLFLGLCREADIEVLDAPRQRTMKGGQRPRPAARKETGKTTSNGARGNTGSSGGKPTTAPADQLFGVTEEDIAALDDTEFDEVWAALGKVARARSRSRVRQQAATASTPEPEVNSS